MKALADTAERRLTLANNEEAALLSGARDENLRIIEREFGTRILARGNELVVRGNPEEVERAAELVGELTKLLRRGHPLTTAEVSYAARMEIGRAHV